MPFDVAGNFTRVHNFQEDRDNGIKILASRVDAEFDNFATGMNAVFFRDGRVPMQADLRMNANRITGIADGSVGSPALKFLTDASTGPYLDGLSRYAISVNGVQRGLFTTTGMSVIGALAVSGAMSATTTLNVTGAATLGSTLGVTGAATLNSTLGVTGVATFNNTINAANINGNTITADNGFLATNGNYISRALGAGSNAQYDLQNNLSVRRGLMFWAVSDDTVKLRRYNAAGVLAEGEISIGATQIDCSVGLAVPNVAYGAGWNGSVLVPTRDAVYDQMELRAPIASPGLTGTPTAPTAAQNTNTTQIATTAYVDRLKGLPFSSGGAITLDTTHRGAMYMSNGGDVTVPGSVFAAGDIITVHNNTAGTIQLIQGAGMSMRLAGTATIGTRTIAQRGIATVLFASSIVCVVTGDVT